MGRTRPELPACWLVALLVAVLATLIGGASAFGEDGSGRNSHGYDGGLSHRATLLATATNEGADLAVPGRRKVAGGGARLLGWGAQAVGGGARVLAGGAGRFLGGAGRLFGRGAAVTGRFAVRHRGTLATIGATAGCLVPAVGQAACGGLQAGAYSVRAQHRGYRNIKANTIDAAFTAGGIGVSALASRAAARTAAARAATRAPQTGNFGNYGGEFLDDAIRSPVVRPDLGNLSSKIQRQMGTRGWTPDLIDEAVQQGRGFPAVNKLGGANTPATRCVHPQTGQSVVIDNATGEVIQVGGPGFRY